MQGVVLFLHLYVGKFSDLFFNDKIFRAKIYIKFVGWAHNAGRSPQLGCCCVEMVLVLQMVGGYGVLAIA